LYVEFWVKFFEKEQGSWCQGLIEREKWKTLERGGGGGGAICTVDAGLLLQLATQYTYRI
jgi:hypothetical protein